MTSSRRETRLVAVAALVNGERVRLMDRSGHPITAWIPTARLGPLDDAAAHSVLWTDCVRRMAYRVGRDATRGLTDPWLRRVISMVASFRLRRLHSAPGNGRRHFDQYPTTTWPAAAKRLVQQGHNRFRVRARTGWERWAYSASNNEKKRADAHERKRKHQCQKASSDA